MMRALAVLSVLLPIACAAQVTRSAAWGVDGTTVARVERPVLTFTLPAYDLDDQPRTVMVWPAAALMLGGVPYGCYTTRVVGLRDGVAVCVLASLPVDQQLRALRELAEDRAREIRDRALQSCDTLRTRRHWPPSPFRERCT